MSALLDFHDAVIYQRDLNNFDPHTWLNDACIGFCFRYMEKQLFPTMPYLLFIDPSVVSLIKVQRMDEEDLEGISRGLMISSRKILFVPTNDNNSFQESSNHWSLLIIDMVNQKSYHLDSSRPSNAEAAIITYRRLQPLLNWEKYPPVIELLNSPQQTNGYDCGVYVCLCAQLFAASPLLPRLVQEVQQQGCKGGVERTTTNTDTGEADRIQNHEIIEEIVAAISSAVTPHRAAAFRVECIEIISALSEKYLTHKNM